MPEHPNKLLVIPVQGGREKSTSTPVPETKRSFMAEKMQILRLFRNNL